MLIFAFLGLCQTNYLITPLFPFFEAVKQKNENNIENLNFSKFQFSFLKNGENIDNSLHTSKFRNFLSSSVSFSKTHILNDEIHERISRKQNGKFHIYDTVFSNCIATGFDSSGGALFVSGDKQQVLIDRCGFFNNSAMISSGSIFAACSHLSVKGSCFERSSAPKFFDISACCDIFNLSTSSIYESHSEEIEGGESSLGITKCKAFSSQLNISNIYSPSDACVINAKNYFSLAYSFTQISNSTGFGLCVILSHSEYTSFVYMTVEMDCDFLDQALFYSASKFLIKDSVILTENRICQKTEHVLVLLHGCSLIGVEDKWMEINSNAETIACLFIVNKYQAENIQYSNDNILCWDQGKHLQSFLSQKESSKNKLFGKKSSQVRLFVKTFILAASGTAFLIVLIISFFSKDEKRPKALRSQQKPSNSNV